MTRPGAARQDDPVPSSRVLVLMGSGETSPTMVTPHQQVFARLGPADTVPAVYLDSPYGFQENADELGERITAYFRESVGRSVEPVRFRSRAEADADPAGHAEAMARLLAARWVFAGPGSPSYALRQWADSPVPAALDARLAREGVGGAVVFASAAALTLGLVTVPVYEVYKVGEDPRWLDGLDVIGRATGLRTAVVPHFDNAEGGTHDTRFCYLGERRLRVLEEQLPDGCFVLGVDEHTGLVVDIDTGDAEVVGRGSVTVRVRGTSWSAPAGTRLTLDEIAERGASERHPSPVGTGQPPAADFLTLADVDGALQAGDVKAALDTVLRMDSVAATRAEREFVRIAVARLGAYAADAPVDRARELAPYVTLLLELRGTARAEGRFAEADAVRDRLTALGVALHDTPDGTHWELHA
jgi:cyanophycinase-like exopeptidase